MARRRVWFPVLVAIALSAAGASVSAVAPAPTVVPDWSQLPDSIRPYVYLSVAELPPFPGLADSLDDFRRWLRFREFEGRMCVLQFGSNPGGDMIGYGGDVDSVWEVADDLSYHAGYRAIPTAQESLETQLKWGDRRDTLEVSPRLGPSYSWRRDRKVGQRSYHWMDRSRWYVYDSSGAIRLFHCDQPHFAHGGRNISNELDFSAEGHLVGFELRWIDSVGGAWLTEPISYWDGRRVTKKEYGSKQVEFYKAVWPRGWN